MTDPVDTDALRALGTELRSARLGLQVPGDAMLAAADEVDRLRRQLDVTHVLRIKKYNRLRIVLTDAPHDTWCASHDWGNDNHPGDARACDCWKADVALDGA